MILNEELQRLAKNHFDKDDRVALHHITGIPISGVYNALNGRRNLTPAQYDRFSKYIIAKAKNEKEIRPIKPPILGGRNVPHNLP